MLHLKKEYVHQTSFKTRLDAQLGIFDYIEAWYNKERSHSALGGLSPNKFEEVHKAKFINQNLKVISFKNNEIRVSIFSG